MLNQIRVFIRVDDPCVKVRHADTCKVPLKIQLFNNIAELANERVKSFKKILLIRIGNDGRSEDDALGWKS
jgi:hypothetical protein